MLVKDIIRTTSAIAIGLTGIIVLVMWIVVTHDKGKEINGKYECHGCNYIFHEALEDKTVYSSLYYDNPAELNDWVKQCYDPYPAFIGFGVTIGVLWILASLIGIKATTKSKAWAYFIIGTVTYSLFVIFLPILHIRIGFAQSKCTSIWRESCKQENHWFEKHFLDSYHQFWGSALLGFLVGAYQIGAAVYLINQNEEASLQSCDTLNNKS